MSFSTKDEIRKMVGAALKPRYHAKEITSEQYTAICRDVSRMMYDRVGDAKGIADQGERNKWVEVAAEEVEKALASLNNEQKAANVTKNGVREHDDDAESSAAYHDK